MTAHNHPPLSAHLTENDVIDLLSQQIDESRKTRLVQHLATCHHCEMAFAERAGQFERRRARPTPHWVDGRGFVTDDTRDRQHQEPSRRWFRPWVFLAPAAAVILFIVLIPVFRADHTLAPAEYWMPVDADLLALRSTGDAGDEAFLGALDAYSQGDAPRAAEMFEALAVQPGLEDLRRIYLASALVHCGEHARGMEILEAMRLDTVPMPWRDRAYLTLAIALDGTGRTEEARAFLEQLRESPEVGEIVRDQLEALSTRD